MRFPGKRKSKHYFPVTEKNKNNQGELNLIFDQDRNGEIYICGIDQLLVDIEIKASSELLERFKIHKGESQVLNDSTIQEIYDMAKNENLVKGEFAGGAVGNTLHNFSILSDCRSISMGAISSNIKVGDYAFKYLRTTSSLVDLNFACPVDGHMGRAMCFITEDGERSFAIGKGIMDEFDDAYVKEDVIKNSSLLLISAFLLRNENSPIYKSTMKAVKICKEHQVPVVFTLGTSGLIASKLDFFKKFIEDYVTIVACNEKEAESLVGLTDPLLALEKILNLTDMCILTNGAQGLYIGAFTDFDTKRQTDDLIHSKSIPQYNMYEYSRAQRKRDCPNPTKIFSHINPFLGGPKVVKNTNGAGDAALSALLHDMAANRFHRMCVPTSPKHQNTFLTYSSIHQIAKYSNRVSFEVLKNNSARLLKGLPEKEDGLEESYWAK